MPFVRWLHKSWKFFWSFVAVLSLITIVLGSILFGLVQLNTTKAYLANRIEQNFNGKYQGVLSIGELDGLIPFRFELKDINLYPDSSSVTPVFTSDSLTANLDVFSLFRDQFIVNALSIQEPYLLIDPNSTASFPEALKKKERLFGVDSTEIEQPFFEIVAPSVVVGNGRISIKNVVSGESRFLDADSLTIRNINLSMFFEYRREQRFLDIDNLTFTIPEANVDYMQVYGQVYNDDRFLEFNSFNVYTEGSSVLFSGEADGVNLFQANLAEQLKQADLRINIDEMVLGSSQVKQAFAGFPDLSNPILLSIAASGKLDSLDVEDLDFQYGNSGFSAYGLFSNLTDPDRLSYRASLRQTLIESGDVEELFPNLKAPQLAALRNATLDADLEGNRQQVSGSIRSVSDRGTVAIDGEMGLRDDHSLRINFTTDSLDLGQLFAENIRSSVITSSGLISTPDYRDLSVIENFELSVTQGSFNGANFDSVEVNASARNKVIDSDFTLFAMGSVLNGVGSLDLSSASRKALNVSGGGTGVDLKNLTQVEAMAPATVDLAYQIQLEGNDLDDFTGLISIDFNNAIVNGDSLSSHLLFADISNINGGGRLLRVTTSSADFSLEGSFYPTQIPVLGRQWASYFRDRVAEEFMFRPLKETLLRPEAEINDQDFAFALQLKDLSYLYAYFPDLPPVRSAADLNGSLTVNQDRLLFNAELVDPKLEFDKVSLDTMRAQLTSSFRFDQSVKEFSVFQWQSNIRQIETEFVEAKGWELHSSLRGDSLEVQSTVERIGRNARFALEGKGSLRDSTLSFNLKNFELGSNIYTWVNSDEASLVYTDKDELIFNNFVFRNDNQLLSVEGVFSDQLTDSVNYLMRGVDLGRVSELINGRIDFDGSLNGTFTTRTLTRIPTIEGNINLDAFTLDDNVVGDLDISSVFNQELNRFDTSIEILTDSTKYPNYFIRNDRDGQNIAIEGYILAPDGGKFPESDSLYYFDLNFNSIDLWVIPFLAPKVFTEMSGIASGSGSVWGDLDDFDFSVDYVIGMEDAVYMKPRFLDTYYYGQGPVSLTREEGLTFQDIYLIDPSGGMAILNGTYNFNGFQPEHSMDISIETDEFQFLNNTFEPDIPFFGKGYGTGVVRLTGTNFNPVISTAEPMVISDFSEIGLPLLEETEFDEDNNFIRFVDSFDLTDSDSTGNGGTNIFGRPEEVDPTELSFQERFTLDLQFIANDPMTVRLIFDPVTGDIITANGTGRIRIQLQDQDLSMFGRFDITDGDYQFVSGDIFTRRFTLEPGGSIVWDGAPDNARINLNAIYSARPNIQTLTTARSAINQDDAQRVRVDLVLNIGGSLSSIENNFFFRLPNTIESRQNSTLSTQIAALNRNEDEKLLQATSFLLMGDFIPSNSTTNAATSLTSNFSSSAAVLNPLLSNQVISPLLSNQINSLLRSDISSFDVDFNLNTYNQIDLGVALRLYNDKLILRRDGQITGAQSNIGDIGATYRINRTLSVTAFHRLDPTFSNFESNQASQQSQDINGVGVEAQFSFNTWNEFLNRISNPFKKLFGKKEQEGEIAQSENRDNN